jgi:two-component system response regulator YesN
MHEFLGGRMIVKKDSLCDLAIEFVLAQKNEKLGELGVEQIARELNVSRSYLARIFKRERNFSLKEYLLREKMIRSTLLLAKEPQMTVKELSEEIGFLDADYFALLFKKYFGISPGKYRECKKKAAVP